MLEFLTAVFVYFIVMVVVLMLITSVFEIMLNDKIYIKDILTESALYKIALALAILYAIGYMVNG